MTDFYPRNMTEFYTEMDRQHRAKGWTGFRYNAEYGARRDHDCYYAERFAGYVRLPVRPQTDSLTGSESAVPFNFIWNRKEAKPDLAYIIAPDTRVPNYTTRFEDALELAVLTGMKSIPVPKVYRNEAFQEMVDAILAHCDEIEDEAGNG